MRGRIVGDSPIKLELRLPLKCPRHLPPPFFRFDRHSFLSLATPRFPTFISKLHSLIYFIRFYFFIRNNFCPTINGNYRIFFWTWNLAFWPEGHSYWCQRIGHGLFRFQLLVSDAHKDEVGWGSLTRQLLKQMSREPLLCLIKPGGHFRRWSAFPY